MEWLNFRHLYAFWMVHKNGGFKAAADSMFVSQSTVSEQVQQLEDYLQKTLIERDTRNFQITEAGYRLLQYAETIFEKSKEINRFLRDDDLTESSLVLKVGIVGGVSRNLLYRYFSKAIEKIDVSKIEVFSGSYEELVHMSLSYELDFFISTQPPHGKDLIHLESRILQKSHLCLAGKRKIISAIRRNSPNSRPLDLYLFGYPYREGSVLERIESRYRIPLDLKLETDDISLLRFFANSAMGVAVVPEIGVREDVVSSRIEIIRLAFAEQVAFYAVYPKVALRKDLIREVLVEKSMKV